MDNEEVAYSTPVAALGETNTRQTRKAKMSFVSNFPTCAAEFLLLYA